MAPVNQIVRTGGLWVRPKKINIPPMFGDDPYITRYVLFRIPWFGIYIHEIHSPDLDRDYHNHPRPFWSFVLRGGYDEIIMDVDDPFEDGIKTHRAGSFHKIKSSNYHGIKNLWRTPTWTLLIVGKQTQDWGFMTNDGFVLAEEYKAYIETLGK